MKRLSSILLVTAHLLAGLQAAETARGVATGVASADRRIQPDDQLNIVIIGETLPSDYRVSASGEIEFPFIRVVQVAGLTPRELSVKLERLLAEDYFVKPEVLVSVREYRQDSVIVIGAVGRPGNLPLLPEKQVDILEAIAMAGGTTRTARNSVEFIRSGKRQVFNLDKLKSESDPAKRIILQPGDILEVKESVF